MAEIMEKRREAASPHTDPVEFLLSKGWKCLGNPAWESSLWLDPEQPLVAHYTGRIMGWFGRGEAGAFLASGLGAIVVLLLYGALFRRGHRGRPH